MKGAILIAVEAVAVVAALDFLASLFRKVGPRGNLLQRFGIFAAVGISVFLVALVFHL